MMKPLCPLLLPATLLTRHRPQRRSAPDPSGTRRLARLLTRVVFAPLMGCALAIPEPTTLCDSASPPPSCVDADEDAPNSDGSVLDGDGSAPDAHPDASGIDGALLDDASTDAPSDGQMAADGDETNDEDVPSTDERCESLMAARVVELFVDPEGADVGAEFVEVWLPDAPQGLVEIAFYNGDATSPYASARLPDGVGDRRVLGAGGEAPLPTTIQNGPDVVTLRVCDQVVQRIVYASAFEDGLAESPNTEYALIRSGISSVRCVSPDATDGDGNNPAPRTWGLAEPSPGAATQTLLEGSCAPPCEPLAIGDAWINELRYDPPGADGAGESEFIELMARRPIDWSTVTVETINGSNGNVYGEPLVVDGVDSWVVIGGADVPYTTHALPRAMQNGPDGVVLLSCGEHLLDAVFYGEGVESGVLEGAPAIDVSGPSIGRDPWGTDTDNNNVDFSELARATPGAPNF